MGSTTSRGHRCSFDAASSEQWRGFRAACSVCGRTGAWSKMVECENDACRHGYAHKRCVEGALRSDCRDGGRAFPATTAVPVDESTRAAAGDVTRGDGIPFTDGTSQTDIVDTRHVACGNETVRAECSSQTDIVDTRHVACGSETVQADCSSQTDIVDTCHIACGSGTVRVDCTSQTDIVDTCRVASGDEANIANGSTTTDPANDRAETDNVQESTSRQTHEYWVRRFTLFSKFDAGIMLDEVSLRSSCTEVSARHLANRCWYATVLNPFCGAGGNAIQLAFTCHRVIAMDADPKKIALAKRNAQVYGVADRIDFMVGDFFLVDLAHLRADAVIASPPCDGRGRANQPEYDAGDLGAREPAASLAAIVGTACAIAPKVVLHLTAKNFDKCPQMATNVRFSHVQYESVMVDGKPTCRNVYFTRNDTNVKRPPMTFSGVVHLKTPSLLGDQTSKLVDNIVACESYLKSVDRFLNA
ncbi:uncharacterized protein LOC112691931 isoform X2 [Sipha flava]|uniref:Trimethylguanosine synthase n=1 Tax=Sipha flava TaxID=143950 RepID=A0A8B8GGU6_9HEMI|nr:uncharacterized protein LOC112691931 isoform X2 [Sipha flava]